VDAAFSSRAKSAARVRCGPKAAGKAAPEGTSAFIVGSSVGLWTSTREQTVARRHFSVYHKTMAEELLSTKKSRGRPATGIGTPVHIRFHDDLLTKLDDYRRQQRDLPSRSEAVRRLVEQALTDKRKR
jgi:hypothetical protein